MNISALSAAGAAQAAAGAQIQATASSTDGTAMFKDIFQDLIGNVNTTDAALQADTIKAAEGELDNPQQLLIDSSKAGIALQLVTSVRNDALQAYSDIIKMSL